MMTRRAFLACTGTAVASAACAFPFVARGNEPELKHVRIGSVLAGTTVAAELLPRYLEPAGVTVEVVNFPNITMRMQAVASGDVQIGYGGVSAAIAMAGRGFPLVLLSNACDGGFAMVARDGIADYADLKGKKVAVQFGSMQYGLLQWKLKQLGMLDTVELLNLNNADVVVALQRGDIDALFAIEPYPSLTVDKGWGRPFGDAYATPAGRTNLAFVAARSFVTRYPKLTQAVLQAHTQATQSLAADPSLAIDTIVRTLNMPESVAAKAMENTFFSADSGPAFRKGVMATGDLMLQSGLAEKLPSWDSFFHSV